MGLSADDHTAIQNLYGRYNHAIDFGDAEAWADCFVDDGIFESGNGSFKGREQLVAFARGLSERLNGSGRHWINNLVIDEGTNGATGKCYLTMYRLGGEGGPSVLTTGVYHDTIAKGDSGWRFTNRKVVADV